MPPYTTHYTANTLDDLTPLSALIAKHLHPPMIVGLTGDIGSGKTTFVRHIAHQLGSHDWVNSPTYAIIQRYHAESVSLLHVDLYRLSGDNDIDRLDLPSQITPQTIAFIEWSNTTTQLPLDLTLHFLVLTAQSRRITITSPHPFTTSPASD